MSRGFFTEIITLDSEHETGPPGLLTSEVVSQLEQQVRLRLGGRIRDFRLSICEMGLVMEGQIRLHGRPLEPDRAGSLYSRHEADVYWSPQLRRFRRQSRNPGVACPASQRPQGAQRRHSIA